MKEIWPLQSTYVAMKHRRAGHDIVDLKLRFMQCRLRCRPPLLPPLLLPRLLGRLCRLLALGPQLCQLRLPLQRLLRPLAL